MSVKPLRCCFLVRLCFISPRFEAIVGEVHETERWSPL
jgi:hypothetical protein